MKDKKYGIERNCNTCHFCFPIAGKGLLCAGDDKMYGKPIEECIKEYPNGCINWDISFSDFCNLEEN